MEIIQRRLLALVMSLLVGLASVPASAADNPLEEQINDRPGAGAMFLDAVLARPMLLAMTATGTLVYVATLPFSALGGNAGEAGRMLVVGPAKATFTRCLGCTKAQDEWKGQHDAVETANAP